MLDFVALSWKHLTAAVGLSIALATFVAPSLTSSEPSGADPSGSEPSGSEPSTSEPGRAGATGPTQGHAASWIAPMLDLAASLGPHHGAQAVGG